MKALIIDNEEPLRTGLMGLIEAFCPEITQIVTADGVKSGVAAIHGHNPDLLFLDVEMDDGTGFDVLAQIGNPRFQLVFVTAHDQYALRAFQFSAIDYLLKPVQPDLLQASVQRAVGRIKNNDLLAQFQVLMQQMNPKKDIERKIVLKDQNATYFVKVSDILFCRAEGTYTQFFTRQHDPILVSHNLKEYENLLEPMGFIRVHHSFLVNPSHIKMFDRKDGGALVLEGDHNIPVSQRKKDAVLKVLES